jgi:type IV fimbrial biogenesis protein FimT
MMTKSKQTGFSLIEMMIAVAIIGILAAFAMPSYFDWIQNTRIRTAAESILNGIQKARSEALMRNTNVKFTLGDNSAWTVECANVAACADKPGGLLDERTSEEGSTTDISITTIPAAGDSITFNNLGIKSTTAVDQLTQVDVDMDGMTDSRDLSIRIAGGSVRMCDPNTGADDPRHC